MSGGGFQCFLEVFRIGQVYYVPPYFMLWFGHYPSWIVIYVWNILPIQWILITLQVIKSEYPPVFKEKMGNKELVNWKPRYYSISLSLSIFVLSDKQVAIKCEDASKSWENAGNARVLILSVHSMNKTSVKLYNFMGPSRFVAAKKENTKYPNFHKLCLLHVSFVKNSSREQYSSINVLN